MTTKQAIAELTACARQGYAGAENRNLATSPCYYAHAFGAYMRASGRSEPTDVRMGRGYSIRCRDLLFTITHPKGGAVTFTRQS